MNDEDILKGIPKEAQDVIFSPDAMNDVIHEAEQRSLARVRRAIKNIEILESEALSPKDGAS